MIVRVNGVPTELGDSTCLDEIVSSLACARHGVAVALNGEVIPRREWSDVTLAAGDEVEVLTAVQGG